MPSIAGLERVAIGGDGVELGDQFRPLEAQVQVAVVVRLESEVIGFAAPIRAGLDGITQRRSVTLQRISKTR